MIEHRGTLISEDLFEKRFVCDLNACKGACCEQGDSGAPITPEEAAEYLKHYEAIKPYMTAKGRKAVAKQGVSVVDMDGELVTPLVEEFQECAFAKKDKQGQWKCAIENAYRKGEVPVHKPLSCHLYPIRVEKLKYHDGLNYNTWDICKPAWICRGHSGSLRRLRQPPCSASVFRARRWALSLASSSSGPFTSARRRLIRCRFLTRRRRITSLIFPVGSLRRTRERTARGRRTRRRTRIAR